MSQSTQPPCEPHPPPSRPEDDRRREDKGSDPRDVILEILLKEPGYSRDIVRRVAEATGGRVTIEQGEIYSMLRALEIEGLLSSYEAEPSASRGGRPRRYYELTAAGIEAVEKRQIVVAAMQKI